VTPCAAEAPRGVHAPARLTVYYADSQDIGAADIDALVTPEDRVRLAAFTHPRRRSEYLAGRALLRYALERSTGRAAGSHRVTTRDGGKPECVSGPAISQSHSGRMLMCAVAPDGEIGIDVQLPRLRQWNMEIARRYFCTAEYERLRGAPADAFYMLWVLKEAYLKALGCGLAGGLDYIECRIEPPLIEARAEIPAHLALYSAGDAFVGVAAVGCGRPEIEMQRWLARSANTAPPPIPLAATAA